MLVRPSERLQTPNDMSRSPTGSTTGGKPIIVVVMGITGSGKSTFIQRVTGLDTGVGHDPESKTKKVEIYKAQLHGEEVWFMDTPGFDDTSKSDTEVLKSISDELAAQYQKDLKVNGVIYLHSILDNRMKGSALKNLTMLQKLVGERSLRNVTLATTMWDLLPSKEDGIRRETFLKAKYWDTLLAFGMSLRRVEIPNDKNSYLGIVDDLMQKNGVTLQIQIELVDNGLTLEQTAAGQEILSDVIEARKELQQELTKLNDDLRNMKESSDQQLKQMQDILEREKREIAEQLRQAAADRAMLQKNLAELRESTANERKQLTDALESLRQQSPRPPVPTTTCQTPEDRSGEYDRLVDLASDFFVRGQMQNALTYFNQALTLALQIFGPNDWRTLECKRNLETIDSSWIGTMADTGFTGSDRY